MSYSSPGGLFMSRNYPVFDSIFQMKMPGAPDRAFRFYQREPKLRDDLFIIRTSILRVEILSRLR
jgi:hypothetical protein